MVKVGMGLQSTICYSSHEHKVVRSKVVTK